MLTKVHFTEPLTRWLGLQSGQMDRLGPIVVLSGPNGSGKSRFLKTLHRLLDTAREAGKSAYAHQVEMAEDNLRRAQARYEACVAANGDVANALNAVEEAQVQRKDQFDGLAFESAAHARPFELSPPGDRIPASILLSYESIQMPSHARGAAPDALREAIQQGVQGGFTGASKAAVAYLSKTAKALYHASHPEGSVRPHASALKQDADRFNQILETLLGFGVAAKLDVYNDIHPIFNGRPLHTSELSSGQRTLLTWAVLLQQQATQLSSSIILLDEPELSLHSDACIGAIERLRNNILAPNGQLWIATHSVPILAYAGLKNIWFVDNGTLSYAGSGITRAVGRLLGGDEGRERLQSFLADADAVAFFKFAGECLMKPDVIGHTKTDDPQSRQQIETIIDDSQSRTNLRVLDFGAGRGRLAGALAAESAAASQRCTFHYVALCTHGSEEETAECRSNVESLAGKASFTATVETSLEAISDDRFDRILLCNTLHEIAPSDWPSVLNAIAGLLTDNGSLLVVEDQWPIVGELPHAAGFIPLEFTELRALLGDSDEVVELDRSPDGRLTAFSASRRAVSQCTNAGVQHALRLARKRAIQGIEALRAQQHRTFQEGRRHGLFAMVVANTLLAEDTLKSGSELL